ncbi:hypothetical protein OFN55_41530, partial [Escherichia coli]|nr:hypothetical protein [Escherichia coli]
NRATEIDGVSKSNRVSDSSFVDGSVTAYAKLHSGEVIKLTQNVSTQYESVKSSALSSLLLSFLWVIPFALFSYWVATFIG